MKQIKVPTIPVKDAQIRVENFRHQFKASVPQDTIPRAILIPIEDLMAIVEKYSSVNGNGDITNELSGVRAYFAVKETDKALPNDITALIVPVDLKGKDLISNPDGLGAPNGDTGIYDFTKPCPDLCDPESPLFVP